MKLRTSISLLWTMIALLGFATQVLANGARFTTASLNGTYYIPCACEGTASDGTAMYTGGMGKVSFDGRGNVTLMQHDVYMEQNGETMRLVTDGIRNDNGMAAERSGRYEVDSEGFGEIVWNDKYGTCDSGENCPLLMITTANGRNASAVFLVIPKGVGDVLIHVTASKQ